MSGPVIASGLMEHWVECKKNEILKGISMDIWNTVY